MKINWVFTIVGGIGIALIGFSLGLSDSKFLAFAAGVILFKIAVQSEYM